MGKGDTREDIEKSMKDSGVDKIVKYQVEQLRKIVTIQHNEIR